MGGSRARRAHIEPPKRHIEPQAYRTPEGGISTKNDQSICPEGPTLRDSIYALRHSICPCGLDMRFARVQFLGMGNSASGPGLPKWGIPSPSKTTVAEKEGSPASLYFRSEWRDPQDLLLNSSVRTNFTRAQRVFHALLRAFHTPQAYFTIAVCRASARSTAITQSPPARGTEPPSGAFQNRDFRPCQRSRGRSRWSGLPSRCPTGGCRGRSSRGCRPRRW